MTSITVTDDILHDLKLLKRVFGTRNMSQTIRRLCDLANYTESWFEYLEAKFKAEAMGVGKE